MNTIDQVRATLEDIINFRTDPQSGVNRALQIIQSAAPAQPPQAQGEALRAALERIWAEAHYSGSPELGLRRMPPALRAAIEDSRAALTATPPAPPAVEPSSIDPWRMRIAAIAAECSDHDTTDALDALLEAAAPQPQAAQDAADGSRYRWLRDKASTFQVVSLAEEFHNATRWDAAIDAELRAGGASPSAGSSPSGSSP